MQRIDMVIMSMYTKLIERIKKIPTSFLISPNKKLNKNSFFIFLFAFLYRLPSLGVDFINNDAFLWKERSYAFGQALLSFDFASTAATYHPGVTLLWSQFFAIKFYSLLDAVFYKGTLSPNAEFIVNHTIQKSVLVFFTSILTVIIFKQLKMIFKERASILIVMFVLL